MTSKTTVECGIYQLFGGTITSDARCTQEITSRTVNLKTACYKKTLFTIKLDLNLRKKPLK
jgi:hypothetical protein